MSDRYKSNGTDIRDKGILLYNSDHANYISDNLFSDMNQHGFNYSRLSSTEKPYKFLSYEKAKNLLNGIWGEPLTFGYKNNGELIQFVDKETAPIPKEDYTYTSPIGYSIFARNVEPGDTEYIRYNSNTGYIQITNPDREQSGQEYWINLSKKTGIFIALQGAGGGGELSVNNLDYPRESYGGGGGGGGAFTLVYVNVKGFHEINGSGESIQLHCGKKGNAAYSNVEATAGERSHLTYLDFTIQANGGSGANGIIGGAGGQQSIPSNIPSWLSVICSFNGGDGGNGGSPDSWGVAKKGESVSDSPINIPILSYSMPIYNRSVQTSGGTYYHTGLGHPCISPTSPVSDRLYGGGGGGGSVCGSISFQSSTVVATRSGRNPNGYGMGGSGLNVHTTSEFPNPEDGQDGCILFLEPMNY